MKFALTIPSPQSTALVEYNGICWPFATVEHAAEIAKSIGLPGFWRRKAA